jgi:BASS family bile acid:Na+ symporter
MDVANGRVAQLAGFLHHRLLWLLVGCYLIAAFIPGPGLWLRSVELSAGTDIRISLPSVLLGLLLFNAGLGVQASRLWMIIRRPTTLLVGVLANLFLPVACILGTATTMQLWHNPRETQEILIGLALIASMPVAGSSTAWVQNADGDLVLSIGLVVLSTCLSPITTPMVLHAVGWMAHGEYSDALHTLAAGEVSGFLAAYVLAPSLAGIAFRALLGETRIVRLRPHLKLMSSVVLLVLCYANAAVALPQTIRNPDWDYLAVMLVIVIGMCAIGFAAGAVIGRTIRADRSQQASLIFGLGMTNNGTGLVVAAGALSHMPAIMLPIIFYNLIQHVVAGFVDHFWLNDQAPAKSLAAARG